MQSSRLVRRIMGALVIAASAQLLSATAGAQSCYPCGVPTEQSSPYTSYGNGGGASITSGGVGGGPSYTGGGGFVYSNGGAATYIRPPTITTGPNVAGPALPYSTGGQATYGAGYRTGSVPGYSPRPTYINPSSNPYPYSSNGYQNYTPPPTITNSQGGYTNHQVPYSSAPQTATRTYTPPTITTGPNVATQPGVYFGTAPSAANPSYTTQNAGAPIYLPAPSAPMHTSTATVTSGNAVTGGPAYTSQPSSPTYTQPPTITTGPSATTQPDVYFGAPLTSANTTTRSTNAVNTAPSPQTSSTAQAPTSTQPINWSAYSNRPTSSLSATTSNTAALSAGAASSIVNNANKLNHIFGKPEHSLQDLVKQFGSREAAGKALEDAAQEAASAKGLTSSNLDEIVQLGGKAVRVTGIVDEAGIVEIGTAFAVAL